MHGPLVSVVMAAYNASTTIAGALLGIVNQRYTSWELIVVDDGSTDDLEREVRQFEDQRIRLIRLARNGGLANALNIGIANARGRYVARMDADDYAEEWRLGDQLRFLMMNGLAVCGTGAEKFGTEAGEIRNPRSGTEIMNTFLMGNPFVHPTVMFDRSRCGNALQYDTSFVCEEDYELWSRLITATNCGNLDYSTLRYRTGASGNANRPQKKVLNRLALERFCRRLGVEAKVPIGVGLLP